MTNSRLSRCAFGICMAVILAGCSAPQPVIGAAAISPARSKAATSSHYCPAYSGGTGVPSDGDFSEATEPYPYFTQPYKGSVFAPDWEVARRDIDFNSSNYWNIDGLCSVDMDGSAPGAIEASAFSTTPGADYTVTFLLSGNGDEVWPPGLEQPLGGEHHGPAISSNGTFRATTTSSTASTRKRAGYLKQRAS
jgi:hypothetical protein